jgi:hypothetical protein
MDIFNHIIIIQIVTLISYIILLNNNYIKLNYPIFFISIDKE